MTERILIMMDERRKFKGIDDQRYKSINRMIHKECNKARETWMNDRCMDIENLSKTDQQMMYEKVSELTRERMYKQGKAIKKKDGTVVMGKEEVMERWDEYIYISELFRDNRQENISIQYNGEGPPILKEEVEDAMNKMKFGKAVGNDGIALEMLKALGNFAVEKITTLANKIYESGELTIHMSKLVFIAIPKVQGTLEFEKHRTISIMSQVTKILLRVVLIRIRNKIRPQISEEQYGFAKGKGTRNAIFVQRNLAEKTLEVNQDLYLCFVDYEKAFDKVKHEDLMKMLERLEIDGKDLRIIKNLYWNQKVAVKIMMSNS